MNQPSTVEALHVGVLSLDRRLFVSSSSTEPALFIEPPEHAKRAETISREDRAVSLLGRQGITTSPVCMLRAFGTAPSDTFVPGYAVRLIRPLDATSAADFSCKGITCFTKSEVDDYLSDINPYVYTVPEGDSSADSLARALAIHCHFLRQISSSMVPRQTPYNLL